MHCEFTCKNEHVNERVWWKVEYDIRSFVRCGNRIKFFVFVSIFILVYLLMLISRMLYLFKVFHLISQIILLVFNKFRGSLFWFYVIKGHLRQPMTTMKMKKMKMMKKILIWTTKDLQINIKDRRNIPSPDWYYPVWFRKVVSVRPFTTPPTYVRCRVWKSEREITDCLFPF